ncbi:MAG: YggS family pyridoxal phosphate-dependent enzyme [Chitinophagales bacterium]
MLQQILTDISPFKAQLVAVSKTKPIDHILEIYEQGQRIFGENKALELAEKYEALPKDIEWHFIGHLQTNKVKYIAPFVSLVHGVDSLKLLKEINKQAKNQKNERVIDCLLQFHIAEEQTKFGLDLETAQQLLTHSAFNTLQNIRLVGVMGMATFTKDKGQVQREFQILKDIFDTIKATFFEEDADFKEISMGMSGDYKLAVTEGSTMVRVGSLIFAKRT